MGAEKDTSSERTAETINNEYTQICIQVGDKILKSVPDFIGAYKAVGDLIREKSKLDQQVEKQVETLIGKKSNLNEV